MLKKKKVKNYTTTISMEKTISQIEQLLVEIGATGIQKEYKNLEPIALRFSVEIEKNETHSFLLPSKAKNAAAILKNIPEYKGKKNDWIEKQSKRTSWRLLLNWVDIQYALIQLGQAEAMQVFLPYLIVGKDMSLYDRMIKHGIDSSKKMLCDGKT